MSWLLLISSAYFFLAFWENMAWAGMGETVRRTSFLKEILHVLVYLFFAFLSFYFFLGGFQPDWFLASAFLLFIVYALWYLARSLRRGRKETVSVRFKFFSALIKLALATGFLISFGP